MLLKSLIVALAMLLANGFAWRASAQSLGPQYSDQFYIRVDGTNELIVLNQMGPSEEVQPWLNGEDCGAGHKTRLGNRFFEHVHVDYALPQAGYAAVGAAPLTATTGNIRAYWDWYYDGYNKSGTENVVKNCHGYAFGFDTWIQDTAFIHADDLTAATTWPSTTFLTDGSAHTIKCAWANPPGYYWDWGIPGFLATAEKNQQSRIYSHNWGGLGDPSGVSDATTQKKFLPGGGPP
jgi:hypothetical protein